MLNDFFLKNLTLKFKCTKYKLSTPHCSTTGCADPKMNLGLSGIFGSYTFGCKIKNMFINDHHHHNKKVTKKTFPLRLMPLHTALIQLYYINIIKKHTNVTTFAFVVVFYTLI